MSYCPLLKFTFPNFSLSSFDILTSNLVYEYHTFTLYRSSSTFVALYILSLGLLSFVKFSFPNFSVWPYRIMT